MRTAIKYIIILGILYHIFRGISDAIFRIRIRTKFKKLRTKLVEFGSDKIKTKEFVDFITHNIILNTNETFFKYKLITSEKSFIKAYPHGIAVKEIFKIWLSKIDSILYKPDKNLNIYEYKNEYKTKNRNIFNRTREKYLYFLTHGDLAYEEDTFYENKDDEDYLKQIVDNGKDTLDRFYNLSFLEVIEIYINKKSFGADQFYEYGKYWLDFYKFYKTNIHRIDYKVEVDMEKIMKVIQ